MSLSRPTRPQYLILRSPSVSMLSESVANYMAASLSSGEPMRCVGAPFLCDVDERGMRTIAILWCQALERAR